MSDIMLAELLATVERLEERCSAAERKLAIALQTIAVQKDALANAERVYRLQNPGAK